MKKKYNQQQVSDYLSFLDDLFYEPNPGLKKIARTIAKERGIPACFRYLTNKAGLSQKQANAVIKSIS